MADVSATLAAWSSTSNSNNPSGTTVVSTGLDDNLREIQGVIVRGLSNKGADIASATTTDLGAVEGLMHDITGTTTITSFGTVRAGIWKILKYEGALTITHNSSSLILLGAENRTTANGDTQIVMSEGSGNWREIAYFPVGINPGKLVSTDETQTLTNKTLTSPTFSSLGTASQATMETGTATDEIVSPGRQHFHAGHPKAWGLITPATTVTVSYPAAGVSVVQNSTGNYTVTHGRTFSSVNYPVLITPALASATNFLVFQVTAKNATTFSVQFYDIIAGAVADPAFFSYLLLGDL